MRKSYFLKQALKELYKIPFIELARRNRFFLRLVPFHPVSASILLTHNCNSRCIMCNMWKEKSYNELTTEEVCDILSQLRELGITRVGFSGGEALLRKDLPYLIRKTRKLRFERVTVLTNAFLLKEKARELLKSGLNELSISLDGPKHIHDMCRGIEGAYEKCIDGLKTLVSLRDVSYRNLDVTIAATLMRPTMNNISHVIDICKESRASLMINLFDNRQLFFRGIEDSRFAIEEQYELQSVIDKLHLVKKEQPSLLTPTHSALEYAKKYFKDPRTESFPCVSGYLCIYIDAHANVFSGCWVLPPMGNLREKRLKEIVFSDKYKERLKNMFLKRCPGCDCGYVANLWYHFPSLIQELAWYISIYLSDPRKYKMDAY
jgi:MoaA/NifB/PqqE/SkfB family radical SAM enzyme